MKKNVYLMQSTWQGMLGPLLTFNLLKKVFFIIFNKSTHPENEKKKIFSIR